MFSTPSTADKSPLKIGVREVPPFVTKSIDGGYDGISIRLWREIAGDHDRVLSIVSAPLQCT
jgi:hypothetical protein